MKTNKVIIRFEVKHGPIYLSYYEDGDLLTDSKLVNENTKIIELNRKLGEIYNSWYFFDNFGVPRKFDKEKQLKDAKIVLSLLQELKKEIINADSNAILEDYETEYFKNLVSEK